MQDRKRQDMQDEDRLLHSHITQSILKCCFEVMNTLGSGFLESIYKNALIISMTETGLRVCTNRSFEVTFRNRKIGLFIPDIIVDEEVIVELKCCENLLPEHQAQLINYLKVTDKQIGLLVNFGKRKIEYKRLYHPAYPAACDPAHPVSLENVVPEFL